MKLIFSPSNQHEVKPNMMHHPVPKEHLEQIGDITVSFALLENTMQDILALFLGGNRRIQQIVTAELSFKNLRILIISLSSEFNWDTPLKLELQKIMKYA